MWAPEARIEGLNDLGSEPTPSLLDSGPSLAVSEKAARLFAIYLVTSE